MEFQRGEACRSTTATWGLVLCAVAAALGCERPTAPSADQARRPERTSVALRVLVVNDIDLAEAIGRQRGEWTAVSSDSYAVEERPLEALHSDELPEADVVVFDTRQLGALCDRGVLRPVRDGVLESKEYDAADVFPLVREKLLRYGGETMALPLGVQAPLMCFRSDLLESPPDEWADYGASAKLLADRQIPVAEPDDRWGAHLLLARAAPLAVHAHHESVLFDPETMDARIAGPPFVKALKMLVEVKREAKIITGSCTQVRAGTAGMAISFALIGEKSGESIDDDGHLDSDRSDSRGESRVKWAELPGSSEVFNPSLQQWDTALHGARRVPLIGIGGRLVGVTTTSRNAAGAFRLMAWLASKEVGSQIGPESAGAMPYRASQLADAESWFGRIADRDTCARLGEITQRVFSHDSCLLVPRIPGVDEYLAALHAAVESVVGESTAPETALGKAAAEWNAITDRLGRQEQRAAYRRHLNLSD